MSKYLKVNVTFFAKLDKLTTDKDFKEQFDNSPSKLEGYFTENEGIGFWLDQDRYVVQDAMIWDDEAKTEEAEHE
jgi:hypothetical protein